MITEDYISFEIAKLLKEKGFECEKDSITAMYNEIGKFHPLSTAVDEYYYDYNDFDEYDYVAPTLQMAMKWLRVVYNLEIYPYHNSPNNRHSSEWWFEIIKYPNSVAEYESGIDEEVDTYEEACETAIKYCLENLI